ncbi:MAG: molecular chaperone DnaJ [Lachnospiraceae bacterium]|nr:molecular chaperone DnaJ [Lachnospiraceae bacterium]
MKQQKGAVVKHDKAADFEKWRFQQAVELEHSRKQLEDERRKFEQEQKEFARQKREFEYTKSSEMDHIKQEQHLFDLKWKILEDELKKLASDKERFEKQKDFYSRVNDYESSHRKSVSNVLKGEMFFTGVNNELTLKKRYKDLIKIYHPDNLGGDTGTIQEINREYDALCKKLDARHKK